MRTLVLLSSTSPVDIKFGKYGSTQAVVFVKCDVAGRLHKSPRGRCKSRDNCSGPFHQSPYSMHQPRIDDVVNNSISVHPWLNQQNRSRSSEPKWYATGGAAVKLTADFEGSCDVAAAVAAAADAVGMALPPQFLVESVNHEQWLLTISDEYQPICICEGGRERGGASRWPCISLTTL